MVRSYTDRPVDLAVVEWMPEPAVHAPSARLSQGRAFLDDAAHLEQFWEATSPESDTAPVVIVAPATAPERRCADRDQARWPVPYRGGDGVDRRSR